jgi:DNA polymerase III sliding clamp (beta) subunit (PCNA family)
MVINSKQLTAALSTVAAICPTNSPIESLKYVRLTAGSDQLRLYATNHETSIAQTIECSTSRSLDVLVRPDRLIAFLRGIDDDVTLDINGNTLVAIVGDLTTQLEAPPADTMADLTLAESSRPYVLDAIDLKRALKVCQTAAAKSAGRFALHGVCIETGDNLSVVATDAARMAIVPLPYERDGEIDGDSREVIPLPAVKLIAAALPNEGECELSFWLQGGITVKVNGTVIHTRTIAGQFPRWQAVLEMTGPTQLSLPAGPLLDLITRVAVTTSVESQAVDCVFASDGITLKTRAADVGETVCHLAAPSPQDECTLSLNAEYLSEAIKALGKDNEISVAYIDNSHAVWLSLDDDTRYCLMPLTTD